MSERWIKLSDALQLADLYKCRDCYYEDTTPYKELQNEIEKQLDMMKNNALHYKEIQRIGEIIMAQEKQFENQVKKYLKTLPKCWYIKVWGGGFQKAGIPDLIAVINGKFVAIELKGSQGKPSELQKRNIRLINEAGGWGIILYPKDFKKFKKEVERLYGDNQKSR